MTIALAVLALLIVTLFGGLVLRALRQDLPDPATDPVWPGER